MAIAAAKAEGSIREKWQTIGLECLTNVRTHGDTSLCGAVYDAMGPSSAYRGMWSKWLRKHGGFTIREGDADKNETSVVYSMKPKHKPAMINVTRASEEKFWEMGGNPSKDPDLIDGWKMITKALDNFDKKKSEAPEGCKVKGPTEAQAKALRA